MAANLKLVSTNDQDLTIDVNVAQDTMADQLDSTSVITSYSHALLNTTLNPVSNPPETWFAPIKANLDTAKVHAMTWISDLAPKIGADIPQTIIDYNNTFLSATDEILKIIGTDAVPKKLSDQEKRQIIALIEATLAAVGEQQSAVKSVKDSLVTLARDFQGDHESLISGKNSIALAIQSAESERVEIEGKIGELQTKLAAARTKVTAAGIGLGLSIFIAVAAFALAVATAGAAAPLIAVGAVGVVGVGVAATFTGIFSAEITQLEREIYEKQRALDDKKKQVTALSGLSNTVQKLVTDNEAAKTALTNVQTMWNNMYGKLESVVKDLKAGKTASEEIVRRMKINSARKAWGQAADWAEKIQNTASGTQFQGVIQDKRLRAMF